MHHLLIKSRLIIHCDSFDVVRVRHQGFFRLSPVFARPSDATRRMPAFVNACVAVPLPHSVCCQVCLGQSHWVYATVVMWGHIYLCVSVLLPHEPLTPLWVTLCRANYCNLYTQSSAAVSCARACNPCKKPSIPQAQVKPPLL